MNFLYSFYPMLFNSVTFLYFFLPLFLLAYYCLPYRNFVLLLASLVFYAWGELGYVALLILSIAINYGFGLLVASPRHAVSRWALPVGVGANLLLLANYKYRVFLLGILDPVLETLGVATGMQESQHFPIGISFFTFQAISYLVDVRNGKAPAERNILTLATYIAMFPQLIAGPIVRFRTIFEELHHRNHSFEKFSRGIQFFAIGLVQKVMIADALARPVDAIYALPVHDLDAGLAWLGSISFSFQIYFDFAGYSNMAIGLGLMLGFHLPRNFETPYASTSIREFWRRWHITLSAWFRDYLYIPLGGNRRGSLRNYRNLVLVFLLCGLWHGANFTFVAWGLYHGAFLVAERLGLGILLERLWKPFRHVYTLLVVNVGFVIFRTDSLGQAGDVLAALVGFGDGDGIARHASIYLRPDILLVLCLAAVGSVPALPALGRSIGSLLPDGHAPTLRAAVTPAALLLVFLLVGMRLASGTHNPFIYFRF
ncbi:MAG: MBOAT family O-acyltransferase [Myxococcota bacterium]